MTQIRWRDCWLFVILFMLVAAGTSAQDGGSAISDNKDAAGDLNTDIGALKKEILKLNRDLFILKEDILFPASTQVNVYVGINQGHYVQLDGVELKLNGSTVASHLYTPAEIHGLVRGGLQKLYEGNLKQGDHQLVAIFSGVGPEQRNYRQAIEYQFTHDGRPVHLEIQLVDDHGQQQPQLSVKPWPFTP